MPRRTLSSLCRCVTASCSISARFGRESPCYGRILGRSCVATVRATVALQGSMLGSWALTLGRWNRSVPCSFALPHDKCAHAHAFITPSLCGCELFNFSTFWARIPLLRKDSGPLLRGDNSRHCGPASVHVAILGADIGPLESLRAMQFRGREWKLCRERFFSTLRCCVAASCSI